MDILKQKIKTNPNNPIFWKELGELLFNNNRLFKSLKCFRRANTLAPCNILQEKICLLEKELEIETDDENEDIVEDSSNILGQSQNLFYNLIMKNSLIKDKLNNPEFQQKILNNSDNPSIIMEDDEILSVMKEMLTIYNKKKEE